MTIRLPLNEKWTQPNNSDKFGSLAYTKNINLDKAGYIKLAPRTVNLFDDSSDETNNSDTDFNIATAFGRTGLGDFYLATTDEPFNISISETDKTIAEDSSSNNPNLNFMSHGCWFQNRFYESTDTTVSYNSGGTWTASAITGLTSGKIHRLAVFKNRNSLCVSNGNVVKQYDTSHSNTVDLTLPSDFEVVGMAYNRNRMGIICRLGSDSSSQNAESYFFEWDGATTSAGASSSIGSYTVIGVVAYKGSFVVINSAGEIKYWNGGGFETLAQFPFFFEQKTIGNLTNVLSYGDNIVVDGDVIYINLNFDFSDLGENEENHLPNNPSGVWCYDPQVGLYHRYSYSNSKAYFHNITEANINTTTDLFTTSAVIARTGSPVMMTSSTSEQNVGSILKNRIYYVIKVSSTTFRLAETREKALEGVYMDITAAVANVYFWMIDVIDFGQSYIYGASGAIALYGSYTNTYTDVIFGGRLMDTALTTQPTLCGAIPTFENRGYFVTPKMYSDEKSDSYQRVIIKHKQLKTNDKIIIKAKTKEILGLPVSLPQYNSLKLAWTSNDEAYTTADLSAVKTALEAGNEIECEFTAGPGAGQMVKLDDIDYSGGTYTLVFAEEVMGATSGTYSFALFDNWTKIGEVGNSNQSSDGIFSATVAKAHKWAEFKIEMRGFETTIERIDVVQSTHEKNA